MTARARTEFNTYYGNDVTGMYVTWNLLNTDQTDVI